MSTTPNLMLQYLAASQSQPEVLVNDAWNKIDTAIAAVSAAALTVATLPTTPVAGQRSFVTDATATTFASTVVGGGASAVPVVFDGTQWIIG